MKIKLLTILIVLSTTLVYAQNEPQKRQEAVLLIRNLDNIGVGYRFGTEKALWRISLSTQLGKTDQLQQDSVSLTSKNTFISITSGREWRHRVSDKLTLRIGGDLYFNYGKSKNESSPNATFRSIHESISKGYGINLVSGIIFQITNDLHCGFEFMPSFGKSINERNSAAGFNDDPSEFVTVGSESLEFRLDNAALRFNLGFNF